VIKNKAVSKNSKRIFQLAAKMQYPDITENDTLQVDY